MLIAAQQIRRPAAEIHRHVGPRHVHHVVRQLAFGDEREWHAAADRTETVRGTSVSTEGPGTATTK